MFVWLVLFEIGLDVVMFMIKAYKNKGLLYKTLFLGNSCNRVKS